MELVYDAVEISELMTTILHIVENEDRNIDLLHNIIEEKDLQWAVIHLFYYLDVYPSFSRRLNYNNTFPFLCFFFMELFKDQYGSTKEICKDMYPIYLLLKNSILSSNFNSQKRSSQPWSQRLLPSCVRRKEKI